MRFRSWFRGNGAPSVKVDFGDGTQLADYRSYAQVTHRFRSSGLHVVTAQCEFEGKPITNKLKVVVAKESLGMHLTPFRQALLSRRDMMRIARGLEPRVSDGLSSPKSCKDG